MDMLQGFRSDPDQEVEQLLSAIEKLRESNDAHKAQNAMLTREVSASGRG
jgi:hypothetical protein